LEDLAICPLVWLFGMCDGGEGSTAVDACMRQQEQTQPSSLSTAAEAVACSGYTQHLPVLPACVLGHVVNVLPRCAQQQHSPEVTHVWVGHTPEAVVGGSTCRGAGSVRRGGGECACAQVYSLIHPLHVLLLLHTGITHQTSVRCRASTGATAGSPPPPPPPAASGL
jgi:hypothetical protein